jgi:hypothetical protein
MSNTTTKVPNQQPRKPGSDAGNCTASDLGGSVGGRTRCGQGEPLGDPSEAFKRASSNSPLPYQTLTPLDGLSSPDRFAPYQLKIDNITILADTTMHKNSDGELTSTQWEAWLRHPDFKGRRFAKFPYRYQYHTHSGYIVQFATPPSRVPEVRVEFNPASMRGMNDSLQLLFSCLRDPRISRIDLCIDYPFDLSDWRMQHTPSLVGAYFHGQNERLETRYFGGKRSPLQLRIYDKRREQIANKKTDLGYDLWRVEAQFRPSADIPLHSIRPFDGLRIWKAGHGLSIQEEAMLYYLSDHPTGWGQLSPNTRRKFKALADCGDLSVELTPSPAALFARQFPRLLDRLNPVLSTIPFGNEVCSYNPADFCEVI